MLDDQIKIKKNIFVSTKEFFAKVEASWTAKNCRNYIRDIVDSLDLQPNPEKPVIALSIGDPTVYGNLRPSPETIQAVIDVLQEGSCNGYAPSVGFESSRQAVADYLSHDGAKFTSGDIILCSGCSSSLEISITALCDARKNHNLLMAKPGFPIYCTLAEAIGVTVKYYNLIPEKNWEIDLDHLSSQIDQNTAAIVLNNPSNPCGSVYSSDHLTSILKIAYSHKIPVIADEIYEQLVFRDNNFISTASLNSGVPILVCGGLAKRFLVPGWRLGWIAVHDEFGVFKDIRKALTSLSQRTIGSNTLIQGALPAILRNTPRSFHDDLIGVLEKHSELVYNLLGKVQGLVPYEPQGTMYMMVKIELKRFPFKDGPAFVMKMMEEESVFCLPGTCFQIADFMRIVLTVPEELLREACLRICQFCARYFVQDDVSKEVQT